MINTIIKVCPDGKTYCEVIDALDINQCHNKFRIGGAAVVPADKKDNFFVYTIAEILIDSTNETITLWLDKWEARSC